MYQKITIAGHLGQDPELRYLSDGQAVCNFNVGVNIGFGDNEQTQWWRISTWGKTAEACNQYLSKGDGCIVDGEVRGDPQTGGPKMFSRRDGTVGTSFEMTAFSVKFLPKRNGGSGGQQQRQRPAAQGDLPGMQGEDTNVDDGSIPW